VFTHTEYITRDGWKLRIEFPGESKYSGQVIVETPTERRHFNAKKNEIHITPARREQLFERARGNWRGERSFLVTEAPGDRVAGIPTRLVSVKDKAGNRMQELNIEPRTGVVLSRRVFDEVGVQVGSFEFQEINLNPQIDPTLFVLRRKGAKITTPADDLKTLAQSKDFLNLRLPQSAGYELDSARVRDIAGKSVLMSQYVSPKGRLMLFQFTSGVDPKDLERYAPKHIHAVSQKIEGRWFVLLGTLDEESMRSFLGTLRPGP
jgi:hypothetical protein